MSAVSFGVRVGSAAFALGLGLVVAAGQGVAAADDPEPGSPPNASSPPAGASSIGPRASGSRAGVAPRGARSAGKVRAPGGSNRTAGDVDSSEVDAGHLASARKSSAHPGAPKDVAPSIQLGDVADPAKSRTAEDDSPDPAGAPRSVSESDSVSADQAAVTSAAATAQPAGIVSGVLALFGFGPPRNGTGTPTAPVEFVTAALSLVSRDITRIFASTGITAVGTPSRSQSLATAARISTPPTVSISSAGKSEGTSGTSNLSFTVTLSKTSSTPITVSYATADGTATAGQDYTAASGTITFAAGQTSKTVKVAVVGDTTVEADETFTVTLSNPSGATISRATATGTIRNDDVALPTVSIADATKTEGSSGTSNLGFTVTLSKAATSTVTVKYATSNGTATAGQDYTAGSGTITFSAGQTSKTVNVAVIGDTTVEPDETFTVTLSSPSGATVSRATVTGTISNDDVTTPQTPTIAISDASIAEGDSGTATMAFTLSLSSASSNAVTVDYATSNGTATAGLDYNSTSGTVTFAPGVTSQLVNVGVIGDTTDESDETFTVTLSAPSGATIADATGTGTIVDNDTTSVPGGPAVPFGSHLKPYAAGTILPTGSQATIDAAVVSLYNSWKSNFVVSAGNYGLAVKSTDADHPYVAEAQGYGLELAALMAGADPTAQATFDGILKYVLAHPSSINSGLLAAEQNASFVSVNGSDSATDGDLAVAYGLLLADKQWGSSGTYNYKQLAVARINAIKAGEMDPNTKLPTLGDWNSPGDSLYNSTRPSDFMIDHFRAFKAATNDPFWDQAVTATQNLLTQQQITYAPNTGLIADFVVNTNTTPKPAPANFLEGKTDGQYSYNAVRVPWHIGTDAVVYGDVTSEAQAQKITAWFRSKTGDDPSKIVSGYKLDGTATVSYLDPEFVATLGPAAMGDPSNQAWLDKIWSYTVAQSKTSAAKEYYAASLMLQSMIVMSGNYWAP